MGPFRRRPLIDMLDAAARGETTDVAGRVTGESIRVALPELPIGRSMFARMHVRCEPEDAAWDAPHYDSATPWECIFRDVLLHSDAGIACLGTEVVADTLQQTDPAQNSYEERPDGLHLLAADPISVDGPWINLLVGGHRNYYHWMLECLARLAGASDATRTIGRILIPMPRAEFHQASLVFAGIPAALDIRFVAPSETLRVREAVSPWSVTGYHRPHPCIVPFFRAMRDAAPRRDEAWPRRLYIDRRGSDQRPLANEEELIAALLPRGFVPVRLETLPLADQIALFAHADMIVAPHGAGLTNLVFARPETQVLELLMDGWVNWCFRHLAALFGLPYDCVLGRQHHGEGWVHARPWSVSVFHVIAALERIGGS